MREDFDVDDDGDDLSIGILLNKLMTQWDYGSNTRIF